MTTSKDFGLLIKELEEFSDNVSLIRRTINNEGMDGCYSRRGEPRAYPQQSKQVMELEL